MVWLQERIHSWKVWKTKDLTEAWRQSNTTVTPSTDYPLSQYFLWSLFEGAWWEEINPGEVLEAAASQSLCELSCQWFTFLSLCLVPFSLRGVKTVQGNRALLTYWTLSETISDSLYKCNMASLTCGGCPVRLSTGCLASDAQLPMTLSFLVPHITQQS